MRLFLLVILIGLSGISGIAQDEDLVYENRVYADYIRSVRFTPSALILSEPIIDLNGPGVLQLSFDDMSDVAKDYIYTVEHCTADWQPSNLMFNEYVDGFDDDVIDDYQFGFNVREEFTNYRLFLPNENFRFLISGNYLLKVYEDEYDKKLVLTRRFVVVENQVGVRPRSVRPSVASKFRTHHEIDFTVLDERDFIRNPRSEVRATVLQNGRWDNAIQGLQPAFVRGNQLIFDYQDKVVFPGGREFRRFDMRSFEYRSLGVDTIFFTPTETEVWLEVDRRRDLQAYANFADKNGKFVIQNFDYASFERLDQVNQINWEAQVERILDVDLYEDSNVRSPLDAQREHDLRSDYANVLFQLHSPTEYEGEVYLIGAFTDWKARPDYRMTYDEGLSSYILRAPFKQGHYDYMYAVVEPGDEVLMIDEVEGNFFETENVYTILVYYRPFGARYDRVISAYGFRIPQ